MILEAFSSQLHAHSGKDKSSEEILHEWLENILETPPEVENQVVRVIHAEVQRLAFKDGQPWFVGRSQSGQRLLESLYQYCKSYDQWQFSRWLHHLRASDFPVSS